MQFSGTTFLLEIVNFLVLVWILKRFLYRPVLDVIARRKADIARTLREAHETEAQAEALRANYEQRLEAWEREQAAARAELGEALAAERVRRMAQLEQALDAEREKNRTLAAREAEEVRRAAEAQALELAGAFAARLLERLAAPALEARLVEIAIEDLSQLGAEQQQALQSAAAAPDAVLRIQCAHDLPAPARQRLSAALAARLGRVVPESVEIVPELLAGLHIALGPWVMQANLRDALGFFHNGVQRA